MVASTIWYSFTPNQSGIVKINTAGSTYDTVAAVYTGSSLNALTPVAGIRTVHIDVSEDYPRRVGGMIRLAGLTSSWGRCPDR